MGQLGERVARRLVRAGVRPGDAALAGVSGGADSVALLHLLVSLRSRLSLALVAVHLDHGLRGEASALDAAFVGRLCQDLQVPLVCEREDIATRALAAGESTEMAGRAARRALFDRVRRERGARWLLLGHHADDQAETLLLRLAHGTGLLGAGAMAEAADDGTLRPLLPERREDLRTYLESVGQTWREDATNAERGAERNRVRLDLLPALEAVRPGAVVQLARSAARLRADGRLLRAAVNALLPLAVEDNGGPWRAVPEAVWQAAGDDLRGQLLREAAFAVAHRYPPAAWTDAWREAPERALARPDLPWLRLSAQGAGWIAHRPLDAHASALLPLPSAPAWGMDLPDGAALTASAQAPEVIEAPHGLVLGPGALVRHPRPSERVEVGGGSCTVREALRRRGVPAACRAAAWLVDDGSGAVAWLPQGPKEAIAARDAQGRNVWLTWHAAASVRPPADWPGGR